MSSEPLVKLTGLNFAYDRRPVLDRHQHAQSRAARWSPSWAAAAAARPRSLRLIGGQLQARRRARCAVDGKTVHELDRGRPVRAAPAHGHAVPVRRAVHRHVGVRQRGLPDARAHRPAGGR
ncbi:MAG: hypothetical protein MZW92_18165 [Comamonadaceae bacterium]|nr:hypothetical protein [Comamonadaceae bacterium]